MAKKILLNFGLLILFLAGSYYSHANDSSIGDDNGSIVFKYQPNISMDKESLYISEEKIEVNYIFTNTSQHDITAPIAFPMPPMYFGQSDHNSIEDFKLWVNGEPVATEFKTVALLDGAQDISAKVKALGLEVYDLASFLRDDGDSSTENKRRLPVEWFNKGDSPRFTLNEFFIWQQHFPAGKSVLISHSYTPSVSTGVPRPVDDILERYKKTTCIDEKTQAGIKQRGSTYGVAWAELNYILVTANNWQGPIKDFNLTIKKKAPSDLLSLCMDGDLKKLDATTFNYTQRNFKPTNNLRVLFIRKYE